MYWINTSRTTGGWNSSLVQSVQTNSGIYPDFDLVGNCDKYLETNLTYQNSIQEENTSRLKSGNASFHSVQNLLTSNMQSKTIKIKIYRAIILTAVLCDCETRSFTFRE